MPRDQELKNLILAATSGNPEDTERLKKYLDDQYSFNSVGIGSVEKAKEQSHLSLSEAQENLIKLQRNQQASHTIPDQNEVTKRALKIRFAGK